MAQIDSLDQCRPGALVNVARSSGFKIGMAVGATRTGKIKVRVWSSNSLTWSMPQNIPMQQLNTIDVHELSSRHRAVYFKARDHALAHNGSPP